MGIAYIVVSVVPILLLVYIWYLDRLEHEPLGLVAAVFAVSALIGTAAAALLEELGGAILEGTMVAGIPLVGDFIYFFCIVALVEEFCKRFPVMRLVWKNREFSHRFAAIVYCVANAESIVHLVSGPGYEGAELPFRIVVFLLLVIGLEQVVIQQCLMASKDTKPTMYVATVGAVVGILLNVAITPRLGAVGSSISWGVSELAVLIAGLVLVKKTLGLRIDFRAFLRSLAFGLCYLVPIWAAWWLIPDIWWRLGVTTVLIVPIFLLVNLRLNPSTLLDEMKVALKRFIR